MKKLNLFLLMLMTLLTLSSFSQKDRMLSNADKCIPADFDSRNATLLIDCSVIAKTRDAKTLEFAKSNMIKHLQKKYPYEYEFASDSVNGNIKYDDKEKYRYVLVCTARTVHAPSYSSPDASTIAHGASSYSSTQMSMGGADVTIYDFHIWDRKSDKHYPRMEPPINFIGFIFRPIINTIVKFLADKK